MQKRKNNEALPKFTGSYKKKSVHVHQSPRRHFETAKKRQEPRFLVVFGKERPTSGSRITYILHNTLVLL